MTEIIDLIKYSFTDLRKLVSARFLSWNKAVVYFFFLAFILAITITTDIWTFSDNLISDAQLISNKLPEFKIADGQMQTNAKAGIYQTDHFIVTFDPNNQRSLTEFDSDASGQAIAVIFRNEELKVMLPQLSINNPINNSDRFTFTYKSLGDFSNYSIKKAFDNLHKPIWLFLVTYLYSLLPAIQHLLFLILSVSIAIKIFSLFSKRYAYPFSEIFKAVLVCSTSAIVLTTLISFLFPTFDYYFIQTVMTFIIYYHIFKRVII